MAKEKQELRDKFMRGNRTRISERSTENCNVKIIENFIKDLEDDGPAGLIHIAALSSVIRRPIRVSTQDGRKLIFGRGRKGKIVQVEFQEPKTRFFHEENYCGHWTLPGNKDANKFQLKNDCLFDVVGFQIGEKSSKLRFLTARKMRESMDLLAEWAEELGKFSARALMLGGARYTGRNSRDAGRILDNSQNRRCYGYGNPGHPRGHASHPSASGPTDSVENYSRTGWKTGFLSRNDQDFVAHIALSHPTARMAMESLNKGSTNEPVRLSRRFMESSNLPRAKSWLNGVPNSEEKDFHDVVLVLRHHADRYKDPEADVFVQTFYPRI